MNAVRPNQKQYYFSCPVFFRNVSISKLYLFIACLAGRKIGVKLCVCDGHIDGYSESVLISKAARGVQSGLDRALKDSVSL